MPVVQLRAFAAGAARRTHPMGIVEADQTHTLRRMQRQARLIPCGRSDVTGTLLASNFTEYPLGSNVNLCPSSSSSTMSDGSPSVTPYLIILQ